MTLYTTVPLEMSFPLGFATPIGGMNIFVWISGLHFRSTVSTTLLLMFRLTPADMVNRLRLRCGREDTNSRSEKGQGNKTENTRVYNNIIYYSRRSDGRYTRDLTGNLVLTNITVAKNVLFFRDARYDGHYIKYNIGI